MWGVVFEEKVEISFVVVYQTAESRDVDLSQIGIHDVLDWEVKDLF